MLYPLFHNLTIWKYSRQDCLDSSPESQKDSTPGGIQIKEKVINSTQTPFVLPFIFFNPSITGHIFVVRAHTSYKGEGKTHFKSFSLHLLLKLFKKPHREKQSVLSFYLTCQPFIYPVMDQPLYSPSIERFVKILQLTELHLKPSRNLLGITGMERNLSNTSPS